MRSISRGWLALLVVAAVGLAACDNTVDDRNNPPTSPTPDVTETFSGTINQNGGATHAFNVNGGGTVTATLTTLTPEGSIAELGLGTWNGAVCQLVLVNPNATQANVVTGTVSSIGSLCVRISDTGKLTGATDYTITVVHP